MARSLKKDLMLKITYEKGSRNEIKELKNSY